MVLMSSQGPYKEGCREVRGDVVMETEVRVRFKDLEGFKGALWLLLAVKIEEGVMSQGS